MSLVLFKLPLHPRLSLGTFVGNVNLDVFLFTFDPQISTPTSFCRQKCLPGPTEIVQNEIASLAERLDQLLGKPQWEDRRVIKTRLLGSGAPT